MHRDIGTSFVSRRLFVAYAYFTSFSREGRSHNWLRISRILKCLSELGLERLNAGFLLHVLNEQSESSELKSRALQDSMDRWWANCLRDEGEREWIGAEIRKVRAAEGATSKSEAFVFTREAYEGALERRKVTGKLAE